MKFLLLYTVILLKSQNLEEASKLYKENKYQESLNIYIAALKKEKLNPYLYYNAANCYYKMGKQEMALAYYIKAFIINPRISYNVSNLKKISKETGNELFSNEIPDLLYKVYYLLSDMEIKLLIHISLISLIISLSIFLLKSKFTKKLFFSSVLCTIIFSSWYLLRKNSIFYMPAITIEEADIFSGPNEKFTILATIPKAKVVTLLNKGEEFSQIGIPQQNIKGWIKNSYIFNIKEEEFKYEDSNRK
ncbi:MAG: tetratricopeptide repeat protein [Elusimicrobiales bacterium]|nr:tetratricopeptide repeat protein [Elusimicrobiales bacterium]